MLLLPRNLRCADLQGKPLRATIAGLTQEIVWGEKKAAVSFTSGDRLILNKTNARAIAEILGDDRGKWVGRDIMLVPAVANFHGDLVDAIRIRPAPKPGATDKSPADSGGHS